MRTLCSFLLVTSLVSAGLADTEVSGVVTDEYGKPLADARVDHTGANVVNIPFVPSAESDQALGIRTDALGHFRLRVSVPAIVIRKPGYRSERLRLTGNQQFKIVLHPIPPLRCKVNEKPRWKEKQANDVDYAGILYLVRTRHGLKSIISGRGPTYSWGGPSDSDVWGSTEYFEIMEPDGVIDARGRVPDGRYWRSKTVFGAAAQYRDVDQETAEQLDCVMDVIRFPRL